MGKRMQKLFFSSLQGSTLIEGGDKNKKQKPRKKHKTKTKTKHFFTSSRYSGLSDP